VRLRSHCCAYPLIEEVGKLLWGGPSGGDIDEDYNEDEGWNRVGGIQL
jgi:hypothetical protein